MHKRVVFLLCFALLWTASAFPQGLETSATRDDWEEINFEFDSSVLVDGYPSLLRLADLLQKNSAYRVNIEGHADYRGTDQYNIRLSQARAETVQSFLYKYGAREGQVVITPRGSRVPLAQGTTPEALFMNRRVVVSLLDGEGRLVSAGGVGDAIHAMQDAAKMQEDCCNKILQELNKLDEILALLKNLQGEHERLKQDVAALRENQDGVQKQVTDIAAAGPSKQDVQDAVRAALPPASQKFSILNLNVGPETRGGNLTASGKGRVFLPFGGRHALQAEGEYMHFFGRDEGQVDLGLVNRFGNLQAGLFTSFKHVRLSEYQHGGSMAQASATFDYIFNRGRLGLFGTKGFKDGAVLNRVSIRPNTIEEAYLSIVDQVGVSTTFGAWGDTWFEGNVGALIREGGDRKAGGTIRYIHPLTRSLAFTAEAGVNETLIASSNRGRVAVGLQFGGWLSPKDYAAESDRPVPVEIPRVRYEVLKRQVRTGNDAPVADAGVDQIGIPAGQVTLDGSRSYDPDDDPITFSWEQVAGPAVQLSGANTATPSFTAAEAQTYHFRLTVRDDHNGVGTDLVTVSTRNEQIAISQFTATPLSVNSGDSVSLVWEIRNAGSAEISGVGPVDATAGSTTVTVTETTTFTLTARNSTREVSQSVTVTVGAAGAPIIRRFSATPSVVEQGGQTTLVWEVENATSVMISGIGNVELIGSSTVLVPQSTTFTLTAANSTGQVSATVAVTVGDPVRIVNFTVSPSVVANPGDPATLSWETQNATKVIITGIGEVAASGSMTVNPLALTTYNLLASDARNQVQAVVVVKVENANRAPIAVAHAPRIILVPAGTETGTGELDGTMSSDPDGDPITFEWVSLGPLQSRILNPTSATPTVEFLGGYGEYNFQLVVRDNRGGVSSPDSTRVLWVDP
jgi:hypothetical protein